MHEKNPLRALGAAGQSVWLDFLDRRLLTSGLLTQLIEADGVSGLTSNPTILESAMAGTPLYDGAIRRALRNDPSITAEALYERLAIEDIRSAADALRGVYDATSGRDGFACIEAAPHLARDAGGTLKEVRRLHAVVDRPNVMIKVPGTRQCVPVIGTLVEEGIPINVTLLFSVDQYDAVARAFARGVRRAALPSPSVASLFVSRIDSRIDPRLDALGTPEARALRGRAAIAVARLTYARYRTITAEEPDLPRTQRVLWASTSSKDPEYSDVRYVEALVAPDTVTTLPMETLAAFRDHGAVPGSSAAQDAQRSAHVVSRLQSLGIDLDKEADELQEEGVAKFAASYDRLLRVLEGRLTSEHAHA